VPCRRDNDAEKEERYSAAAASRKPVIKNGVYVNSEESKKMRSVINKKTVPNRFLIIRLAA